MLVDVTNKPGGGQKKKNMNQKKWKRLGNEKEQITDKENKFGGNLEGKKRAMVHLKWR